MSKPIEYESNIIANLRAEGWQGDAETLRELARAGERLRKRYENECSYEWAANSESYAAGTERAEERLAASAKRAGLTLFVQGDPRGALVYVRNAPLPISDSNYSSVAHCLYFK